MSRKCKEPLAGLTWGRLTADLWADRWVLGWVDRHDYWHWLFCVCWRPRPGRRIVRWGLPWSRRRW